MEPTRNITDQRSRVSQIKDEQKQKAAAQRAADKRARLLLIPSDRRNIKILKRSAREFVLWARQIGLPRQTILNAGFSFIRGGWLIGSTTVSFSTHDGGTNYSKRNILVNSWGFVKVQGGKTTTYGLDGLCGLSAKITDIEQRYSIVCPYQKPIF